MIKQKGKEWLKRYLPAEIVATFTAVGAASIAHVFYKNHIITAYAGSFGEAIGFYSTILIQNILIADKENKIENKRKSFSGFTKIIAAIIIEFGPAGIIDGLLLRPFFMFLFPVFLKNFTLGILFGKIAGDLIFYFLVIFSYEMRNKYKKTKKII